jgi:hypothetical protein
VVPGALAAGGGAKAAATRMLGELNKLHPSLAKRIA